MRRRSSLRSARRSRHSADENAKNVMGLTRVFDCGDALLVAASSTAIANSGVRNGLASEGSARRNASQCSRSSVRPEITRGRRTRVCTGTLPFSGFPLGLWARAGQPRAALTCAEITAPRIVVLSPWQAGSRPSSAEEALGPPPDRYRARTKQNASWSRPIASKPARPCSRVSYDSRLALAYQTSDDDTLARFTALSEPHPASACCNRPRHAVGPRANAKLLVHQALNDGADFLLLVDADLGGYDPCNLERVLTAAEQPLRSGAALWSPRSGEHHQLFRQPAGLRVVPRVSVSPLPATCCSTARCSSNSISIRSPTTTASTSRSRSLRARFRRPSVAGAPGRAGASVEGRQQ